MTNRANYALSTNTFGEEHYLQISCEDRVLATAFKEGEKFVIHDGLGVDHEGNDLTRAVREFAYNAFNDLEKWQEVIRFAYLHALAKLMKEDREAELA